MINKPYLKKSGQDLFKKNNKFKNKNSKTKRETKKSNTVNKKEKFITKQTVPLLIKILAYMYEDNQIRLQLH